MKKDKKKYEELEVFYLEAKLRSLCPSRAQAAQYTQKYC